LVTQKFATQASAKPDVAVGSDGGLRCEAV